MPRMCFVHMDSESGATDLPRGYHQPTFHCTCAYTLKAQATQVIVTRAFHVQSNVVLPDEVDASSNMLGSAGVDYVDRKAVATAMINRLR